MSDTQKLKSVVFQIRGKKPEQPETEKLSGLTFGSGRPGEAEVKDALKWFFIGIIAGVVLFFFGRWVIRRFVGPGVLVFGYGGAYLGAPVSVIVGFGSLFKLFRSAHKKKAADALRWAWMVSVLGDDAVGARFGQMAYTLSTMRRLLPEGTGFDAGAFEAYVTAFRDAMSEAADETASEWKKNGWHESGPNKSFKLVEDKEIQPNLHEVTAVINYNDQLAITANNKTRYMTAAKLELHITQYFVKAGKYWFPYDVTPAFGRADTAAAADASAE